VALEWLLIKSKTLKEVPNRTYGKKRAKRLSRSPPLIYTPALKYMKQKELASFYNTIELFKVLCDDKKHICDCSDSSRSA